MTPNQKEWADARDRLGSALAALGYPEELADLLARQLKSPKAIGRMTSYVREVRPRSMEMIADELFAICSDVEAWHAKKAGEAAQAGYNAWLNSAIRWQNAEEEDD